MPWAHGWLRCPPKEEAWKEKRRRARRHGGAGVRGLLGGDAIGALAVAAFEGLNGIPPLLPDCAAQKSADRVRLPASRLHELLKADTGGPFHQIEDFGRFAAAAGSGGLVSRRGLTGGLGLGR